MPSYRTEAPDILLHGGRLRAAALHYDIPLAEWLDLSSGVNPGGWPVPAVPSMAWSRLPEDDDGLEQVAREYYATPHVLPSAGSQAAIQALPTLIASCCVRIIQPSYAEHALAWRRAGHKVQPVSICDLDSAARDSDVVVLVHPNNPTGTCFEREQLLRWHEILAARGGWLVVDEAFIDTTPEKSLTQACPRPGLIVLRSLGKFFGLAGVRVGFVCAEMTLLDRLHAALGPWTVAGPSRWVATHALNDRSWQDETRPKLRAKSARLAALLQRHGLTPQGHCDLFQWVPTSRAADLHELLARAGILTRLYDSPASLRFGLPGTEADWSRLDTALANITALDRGRLCK